MYEAVKQKFTEDDPTTTDWEGSKGMMNQGKIGCMVLGSWAISQIQGAGDNADDIAYMPFPISVNGKQYAAAGLITVMELTATVQRMNRLLQCVTLNG